MIGSYDDISHRLSELFHIRSMKSYLLARPGTGQSIGDTGGLLSPEVGDPDAAITRMQHDRPVTLLWIYEHDDDVGYQNFVYVDKISPYTFLPIDCYKAASHDHGFTVQDLDEYSTTTSVPHGHATVDGLFRNKHWDVVSMRNFPERVAPAHNWVYNVRTINTDWVRTGQTYGQTGSISRDSTETGMVEGTRFHFYESYFWQYADPSTPYQTQGLRGPVICFDRALSDDELHEFCCAPYEILRRHWSDVLFAVSPLTGEDFSLRRNHWTARYSTSTVTAEIESSSPVGLIPGIDHSSARVSGRLKSYFMPPAGPKELTAGIDAVSTCDASLVAIRAITADVGSASTVAASLFLIRALTAEIDAVSTVDASLVAIRAITANVAAGSSVESSLVAIRALTANVAADSNVDAVVGRILDTVAGIDAASTCDATLQRIRNITVSIGGVSVVTATVEEATGVKRLTSGVAAVSTVEASLVAIRALTANVTATSVLTAPVVVLGVFQTGIKDVFTVPGGGKTFTIEGGGKTFTV